MITMADQWNLYFWLEWTSVVVLVCYHALLLVPPSKRPRWSFLILTIPMLGLLTLLVLSLVRPSFRWPLYPALVLTLVDIVFALLRLRSPPRETAGVAAVLRTLGAVGMLLVAAAGLALVWSYPPTPVRSEVQVAMQRVGAWIRIHQAEGGRPIRWRADRVQVMEDYLLQWSIPRLDDRWTSEAPAVAVIGPHPIWDHRLLLEDLAQAGFDVWAYEGTMQDQETEEAGWGPPYSWNWLRWPEFLSRLTESVLAAWSAPPPTAEFLNARLQDLSRRLALERKSLRALVLMGQWQNLSNARLPETLAALVRWGGSDLPRTAAPTTLAIFSGIPSKPGGVRVSASAEGLTPMDLSDNPVIRPWLGLPHIGRLGPNAAQRYASARELTMRVLQAALWAGDPTLLRVAQLVLPGGLVVLGSP